MQLELHFIYILFSELSQSLQLMCIKFAIIHQFIHKVCNYPIYKHLNMIWVVDSIDLHMKPTCENLGTLQCLGNFACRLLSIGGLRYYDFVKRFCREHQKAVLHR